MLYCPCNSQKNYALCCEPFLTEQKIPSSPESLMRSRYTAFTQNNMSYILRTMREQALKDFNEAEAKRWAKRVKWIKLNILQVAFKNPNTASVTFEASYVDGTRLSTLHEKSEFKRDNGQWFYILGTHLPPLQTEKIISRNQSCPCGSPRKFKNCHGV